MAPISFIKPGTLHIDRHSKVIKADEYMEVTEAVNVLEKARITASQIQQSAKDTFENEFQKGYDDGLAHAQKTLIERHVEVVANAITWIEQIEKDLEAVVEQSVRRIIRELDIGDVITDIVQNALKEYGNLPELRLRVSPSQFEFLHERLKDSYGDGTLRRHIRLEKDLLLHDDDCVLESPLGNIELGLTNQLEILCAAIKKNNTSKEH